jgi:RHH-type transcriptional regulator, rel operon repressor / antitoxin RelB
MPDTATLERPLNVRLSVDLSAQIEALCDATGRTKSFIAQEALKQYLEVQAWQIADIQAALKEADRGEFATQKQVDAFFKKYGG